MLAISVLNNHKMYPKSDCPKDKVVKSCLKILRILISLLDKCQTLILLPLLPNNCWMLKKYGNKAYPSFTGQPKELSFYGKDTTSCRETIPGLSPSVALLNSHFRW